MRSKAEMLHELETMLTEVLAARNAGMVQAKISRAQGCVDGYMRALLGAGIASKQELLALVGAGRQKLSGPAVKYVDLDEIESAAA